MYDMKGNIWKQKLKVQAEPLYYSHWFQTKRHK